MKIIFSNKTLILTIADSFYIPYCSFVLNLRAFNIFIEKKAVWFIFAARIGAPAAGSPAAKRRDEENGTIQSAIVVKCGGNLRREF